MARWIGTRKISLMPRRLLPRRLLAWLAIAALLLDGALPLLAARAASARGVAVAEVCSVVGVITSAPARHDDGSSAAAGHACALALLPAWAAQHPAALQILLAPLRVVALRAPHVAAPRGRRLSWAAPPGRGPPPSA